VCSRSCGILVNFGPLLRGRKFSRADISHCVVMRQKLVALGVLPVDTYSPDLVNFGPVISLRCQSTEVCKKFVTHFLYVVRQSVVQCNIMRGIGA